MVTRIVQTLKTASPRRLLWMAVLFSEIFAMLIVCLMSLLFHGRITRDYLITGAVTALPVSALAASLLIISLFAAVRKAESTAEEESEITKSLIDNSAVATFVLNAKHTVIFWNKACEELSGVLSSSMVGTDNHWQPFYAHRRQTLADVIINGNVKDLPSLYDKFARSTLIANGLQAERWYKNLNGKNRYLIFSAVPIYNAAGELTMVIETIHDHTHQKRMEEELAKSEGLLRTIINTEPECVMLVAADGNILDMNPAGLAMFEADSLDRIAGAPMISFLVPEYRPAMQVHWEKVFRGESDAVEFEIIGMKGARRWLDSRAAPIKGAQGEITALLGVARDITGLKRSEEEREKLIRELQNALNTIYGSQKEWQDTFDSIKDMIAIIDEDYTIVKANRAFSAYFGLHPRDVIKRKYDELLRGTGLPVLNRPDQGTPGEQRPKSEEMFNSRTNEIFRVTTFPYSSPAGDRMGSIHIARDITAEKEKEMRLIMSERLAALGEMASGIAHEINNPLASIAGCSEGLLNRVRKGQHNDKLFETYLNIIQEEVFRCKSITTAMLSFVRKTTYEKKDIRINEMLDKTIEIIGFQGRLKSVEVRKHYAEGSLNLSGSEGELRQVFLAVITNALDAMEDKGVLTVETVAAGGGVSIRIHNTGPGIPADLLTKIFDPFFTTKSEKGGTGLGLSIARKIVLNHGGNIDASSEQGKGTTFSITFPV
jgi:two-component system NtrC family sensor kinase